MRGSRASAMWSCTNASGYNGGRHRDRRRRTRTARGCSPTRHHLEHRPVAKVAGPYDPSYRGFLHLPIRLTQRIPNDRVELKPANRSVPCKTRAPRVSETSRSAREWAGFLRGSQVQNPVSPRNAEAGRPEGAARFELSSRRGTACEEVGRRCRGATGAAALRLGGRPRGHLVRVDRSGFRSARRLGSRARPIPSRPWSRGRWRWSAIAAPMLGRCRRR